MNNYYNNHYLYDALDDALGKTIVTILFAVAVAFIIQYLIAVEFYKVASEKGYNSKKYLWLPFFFGLVGYLLVIALPVKNNSGTTIINNDVDNMDKQPTNIINNNYNKIDNQSTKEEWKCPQCGRINSNYVGTCGCGQTKPR